ncbi:OTU domain-containing protein [Celerinatantimonas sp. YJH-8]|uniref:OTU domain-containing protein n=1 Tax=Celerinatantimonas sp. YJH-8 TaxID=3228714 RepID=UPI0038C66936
MAPIQKIARSLEKLDCRLQWASSHVDYASREAVVKDKRIKGAFRMVSAMAMLLPAPYASGPFFRSFINGFMVDNPDEAFNFLRSFGPSQLVNWSSTVENRVNKWGKSDNIVEKLAYHFFQNSLNAPATVMGTDGLTYRVDGNFAPDYQKPQQATLSINSKLPLTAKYTLGVTDSGDFSFGLTELKNGDKVLSNNTTQTFSNGTDSSNYALDSQLESSIYETSTMSIQNQVIGRFIDSLDVGNISNPSEFKNQYIAAKAKSESECSDNEKQLITSVTRLNKLGDQTTSYEYVASDSLQIMVTPLGDDGKAKDSSFDEESFVDALELVIRNVYKVYREIDTDVSTTAGVTIKPFIQAKMVQIQAVKSTDENLKILERLYKAGTHNFYLSALGKTIQNTQWKSEYEGHLQYKLGVYRDLIFCKDGKLAPQPYNFELAKKISKNSYNNLLPGKLSDTAYHKMLNTLKPNARQLYLELMIPDEKRRKDEACIAMESFNKECKYLMKNVGGTQSLQKADRNRLRNLLGNLLPNVLKYFDSPIYKPHVDAINKILEQPELQQVEIDIKSMTIIPLILKNLMNLQNYETVVDSSYCDTVNQLLTYKAYCYAYGKEIGGQLGSLIQGGILDNLQLSDKTESWGAAGNATGRYAISTLQALKVVYSWRSQSKDFAARLLFPLAMYISMLEIRFGTYNTPLLYRSPNPKPTAPLSETSDAIASEGDVNALPIKGSITHSDLNTHVALQINPLQQKPNAQQFQDPNSMKQPCEKSTIAAGKLKGQSPLTPKHQSQSSSVGVEKQKLKMSDLSLIKPTKPKYDEVLIGIIDSLLSSAYFYYHNIGWDYTLASIPSKVKCNGDHILSSVDQFNDWKLFEDPLLIGYVSLLKQQNNFEQTINLHFDLFKVKFNEHDGTRWWAPANLSKFSLTDRLVQAMSKRRDWLLKSLLGMKNWMLKIPDWDTLTLPDANAKEEKFIDSDTALDPKTMLTSCGLLHNLKLDNNTISSLLKPLDHLAYLGETLDIKVAHGTLADNCKKQLHIGREKSQLVAAQLLVWHYLENKGDVATALKMMTQLSILDLIGKGGNSPMQKLREEYENIRQTTTNPIERITKAVSACEALTKQFGYQFKESEVYELLPLLYDDTTELNVTYELDNNSDSSGNCFFDSILRSIKHQSDDLELSVAGIGFNEINIDAKSNQETIQALRCACSKKLKDELAPDNNISVKSAVDYRAYQALNIQDVETLSAKVLEDKKWDYPEMDFIVDYIMPLVIDRPIRIIVQGQFLLETSAKIDSESNDPKPVYVHYNGHNHYTAVSKVETINNSV